MQHVISPIIQVCDAIMAGPPGARRNYATIHIQQIKRPGKPASNKALPGLEKAYAIQAGGTA
jgi:hypothetical protein